MSPDRWQQIKTLFDSAVGVAPDERAALLAERCADPEARAEVERLLRQHDRAGSFLDGPAIERRTLSPGQVLADRFRIVKLAGRGGMGEVYEAHDTRLDRRVALKFLPDEFAFDRKALARFEREARAIAALNHPHICTVYDTGTHEQWPFIVMEYIEGATLEHRLKKGALPLDQALQYAVEIAGALDQAHRNGVIHRDLKPANIMLTKAGAKVLDFGLAKVRANEAVAGTGGATGTLTEEGAILGTLQYMAPEQLEGKPSDARTDIFAFGAVLYEMVTGRKAFAGGSQASLVAAIIEREPAVALGPRSLDAVVKRCLAKEPEERWQNAADVGAALKLVAPASDQAPQPIVRRGLVIATAIAVAGLALMGPAVWLWYSRTNAPQAPVLRYLTYSGRDSAPAASPDGRIVAFTSKRDGRPRIWLKDLTTGGEGPLTEGPDDGARFSPDGSTILFVRTEDARAALFRTGVVGGQPRRLVDVGGLFLGADWSPDGRRIAFAKQNDVGGRMKSALLLVDVEGADPREIADVENRRIMDPRWSSDGRTIAAMLAPRSAGYPFSILVVQVDTRRTREISIAAAAKSAFTSIAWSGVADEIVYSLGDDQWVGGPSRILRHNIRTGKVQILFHLLHSGGTVDVAGPGRLVLDTYESVMNLQEISLDQSTQLLKTRWLTRGQSWDWQPVYSPDGAWVVFSSTRTGNRDLWAVSPNTGALRRLTDHLEDDWDPAFSPDGKQILWSSRRGGHYEIWMASADGSGARQVSNDGADAENATMTDSGWIVYVSGEAALWRIRPDGSAAVRLGDGSFPEVSPDGQYLLYVSHGSDHAASVRVIRVADWAPVPFEIRVEARKSPPIFLAARAGCRALAARGPRLLSLARMKMASVASSHRTSSPARTQVAPAGSLAALIPTTKRHPLASHPTAHR